MRNDLLGISTHDYKDNSKEVNKLVEEWLVSLESVSDDGENVGYEMLQKMSFGLVSIESAIAGNTALNRTGTFFSKLINIATSRQSGFANAMKNMNKIDISGINHEASKIGLTPEIAAKYARITQAFNYKASESSKREWSRLFEEINALVQDRIEDAESTMWKSLKEYFYGILSYLTIVLFPLGIYFMIMHNIHFVYALYLLATHDKDAIDSVRAKGIQLVHKLTSEFVYDTYIKFDPSNSAKVKLTGGVLSATDMNACINYMIGELNQIKMQLKNPTIVSYEEKVKAAEIIAKDANLHLQPHLGSISKVNAGILKTMMNKSLNTKAQSLQGYTELRETLNVYNRLGAIADLYFDVTNGVLSSLYKM